MGFSSQEYWSGLPFPSPGDLPSPETEPTAPVSSALQVILCPLGHQEGPMVTAGPDIMRTCSSHYSKHFTNICLEQFTNSKIFNSCNTPVRYYYYLPDPRIECWVSCITGRFFPVGATTEAHHYDDYFQFPHFADEDTEAWKGEETCPLSQTEEAADLRFESRWFGWRIYPF